MIQVTNAPTSARETILRSHPSLTRFGVEVHLGPDEQFPRDLTEEVWRIDENNSLQSLNSVLDRISEMENIQGIYFTDWSDGDNDKLILKTLSLGTLVPPPSPLSEPMDFPQISAPLLKTPEWLTEAEEQLCEHAGDDNLSQRSNSKTPSVVSQVEQPESREEGEDPAPPGSGEEGGRSALADSGENGEDPAPPGLGEEGGRSALPDSGENAEDPAPPESREEKGSSAPPNSEERGGESVQHVFLGETLPPSGEPGERSVENTVFLAADGSTVETLIGTIPPQLLMHMSKQRTSILGGGGSKRLVIFQAKGNVYAGPFRVDTDSYQNNCYTVHIDKRSSIAQIPHADLGGGAVRRRHRKMMLYREAR